MDLHRIAAITLLGIGATLVFAGCSAFSTANSCLVNREGHCLPNAESPPPPKPTRATLAVDGLRGNPRVLMVLAFSGGGSRAANLSTETMIALKSFKGADLLSEVDVLSAVSGGTLPSTFYASTRDTSMRLAPDVAAALDKALLSGNEATRQQLKLSRSKGPEGPVAELSCGSELELDVQAWLLAQEQYGKKIVDLSLLNRIRELCRQANLKSLRSWSDADARERMRSNFVARMLGTMLLPGNILRYWTTSYDRSDIMAQVLSDNLYDQPIVGIDHNFGDLNPTRPFLVIHATDATDYPDGLEHVRGGHAPFGSSFTFTREDFHERLHADINGYPLGRAVMASSAFPLAFPHVTLRNYHELKKERRCATGEDQLAMCSDRRFLHLIDGGNADNLGLHSVKRMLLDMAWSGRLVEDHDAIVVLLVDAFADPRGASSKAADPRSGVGRIVDIASLSQAVDVLLKRGRQQTLDEFSSPRKLLDVERDCPTEAKAHWQARLLAGLEPSQAQPSSRPESREAQLAESQLPHSLCLELLRLMDDRGVGAVHDFLDKRLVFHRIGLDTIANNEDDKHLLGRIPTSFAIDDEHADLIQDRIRKSLLDERNHCLDAIAKLVGTSAPQEHDTKLAQAACGRNVPFDTEPLREAKRTPPPSPSGSTARYTPNTRAARTGHKRVDTLAAPKPGSGTATTRQSAFKSAGGAQ